MSKRPSPASTNQSSGSDEDLAGQRKRKRMLSNRESARRSRMRKQQHLEDLSSQAATLMSDNRQIAMQVDVLIQQFIAVESENNILRAEVLALTERLQSLNAVLRFVEEVSGTSMDIPEIPDPLLKPWQLPCPSQLVTASSANMFH